MDLSNLSDFYPLWNEMDGSNIDHGGGQPQPQLQLRPSFQQGQRSTPALQSQHQFHLPSSNNQAHVASLTSTNGGPTTNIDSGQRNDSNNSSSNDKNANSTISSSWNSSTLPSQLPQQQQQQQHQQPQQQQQQPRTNSNIMAQGAHANTGTGAIPTAVYQNGNGFTASTEFWNQQMGMPSHSNAQQTANFPFTLGHQLNGQANGHLVMYPFQIQQGPPQSIQFVNQSSTSDGAATGGAERAQPGSANTNKNTSQTPIAAGKDSGNSMAFNQMLANSSSAKASDSACASAPKDVQSSSGQGTKSGSVSMTPFIVPGPVDLNPIASQNLNVTFAQSPFQWRGQENAEGTTSSSLQGQHGTRSPSRSSSVAAVDSTNNGADDYATSGARSDAPSEMRLRQLRERNNREQKRAQKITELIDTLRKSMVEGGWKTEVKSKSSTLDQIKTYIEHLQGLNQEKTNQVKEARKKLEQARNQVRERESAKLQSAAEGGSDPESVMSSLTSDSTSSNRRNKAVGSNRRPSEKDRNCIARGKRSAGRMQAEDGDNQDQLRDGKRSSHRSTCKRPRSSSADSSKSSELGSCETNKVNKDASDTQRSSSEGIDADRKLPAHDEGRPDNINTDNRSLSRMSDVTSAKEETDSNIAIAPGTNSASDKADGVAGAGGTTVARSSSREDTTVLVPEIKIVNRKRSHSHHKRKGKIKASKFAHSCLQESLSSLDEEFKLNYREVFLMSNVPQLIATVTGRIVAWNHFFIALSGLRSREVKRMTIFSIVDIDRLSSLFELVAAALKGSKYRSPSEGSSGRNNKKSHIGSSVGTNISKGEVSALTPASGCGNSSSGSSGDGTGEKAEESSKDGGSASTNKKEEVPSVVQNKEAKAAVPAIEQKEERERIEDYRSVTLPCIDFESFRHAENLKEGAKMREFSGIPSGQIYMTVTLMDDEEETKRCFHCAFTNTEPTKHSVGSVSQSLITEMFSIKRDTKTPVQTNDGNHQVKMQEYLSKSNEASNTNEYDDNLK